MSYHLVCVQPFHGYVKGQTITDPVEIAKLSTDRDHHFVRIGAPAAEKPSAPAPKKA